MRKCGKTLTDADGYKATCARTWGTEHSHHDLTARQAVEAGLALAPTTAGDLREGGVDGDGTLVDFPVHGERRRDIGWVLRIGPRIDQGPCKGTMAVQVETFAGDHVVTYWTTVDKLKVVPPEEIAAAREGA